MELFPAIDLRDGKAVRLLRGDYDKMTVYSDSPLEVARSFRADGAKYLHLVDLDGAKDGGTPNFQVIREIVEKSGLSVEVGGGIRSMETAEKYLDMGAMRVIIGTAAVTDPQFLKYAVARYGGKITVGVDVKGEAVATHGWTQTSEKSCFDFCGELQALGVKTVICTDISRDGAMQGVNSGLYRRLTERFDMDFIASGGVTGIEDLALLSETGVSGAILGKSLYTGGIALKEAVKLVERLGAK